MLRPPQFVMAGWVAKLGYCTHNGREMHVITEKRIWEAKKKWPHSATALDTWYRLIKACKPDDFGGLRAMFPATDKVGRFHVFNIGGNKIRLIASINYSAQRLYIKHVFDHREYDKGNWRSEQ
jgi:mRNA interferase HigB